MILLTPDIEASFLKKPALLLALLVDKRKLTMGVNIKRRSCRAEMTLKGVEMM